MKLLNTLFETVSFLFCYILYYSTLSYTYMNVSFVNFT